MSDTLTPMREGGEDSAGVTWATMSWFERGQWIRLHRRMSKPLSEPQIIELFHLTDEGARAILDGDTWKPDYQRNWPFPPTESGPSTTQEGKP